MRWRKSAQASRSSDLTAFIDEGSEIEGKYTFQGTVMLNGKFSGEISSNDSLIIGEKGVVNATVRAGVVLINGEVIGNVFATERVELRGTARVYGDVEALRANVDGPNEILDPDRRPLGATFLTSQILRVISEPPTPLDLEKDPLGQVAQDRVGKGAGAAALVGHAGELF